MKRRVLIIDDDNQLNQVNKKVLLASDMVSELHITINGKEAMDYITSRIEKKDTLPNIIILDLNMPVMNGFQFIDEFQKLDFPEKSKIEIVVFTSSSNPKDKQHALSKGIKHYLNKPYILREFTDINRKLRIETITPHFHQGSVQVWEA